MKFLTLIFLMVALSVGATTFTEFYVNTAGDNLNSGSGTNAVITFAGGTFVRSTGVFTTAGEDPGTNGIRLNVDFASVYTTSGATTSTCVALITATNSTTVTVSTTVLGGATANVSETAAAATMKIGGAWAGPNAGVGFPFNFVTAVMTNNPSVFPRVNFKNGVTYAITAGITHSLAGPIRWQGYTTTPGDLGKATIDCSTVGAGITMLTLSAANNDLVDFIISNSGATSGTTDGITVTGTENVVNRVVVHDVRRAGFNSSGAVDVLMECEAYLCNKGNTASQGGFVGGGGTQNYLRCVSHDNAGSNNEGFVIAFQGTVSRCIADTNGKNGFNVGAITSVIFDSCDAYNNGSAGMDITATSAASFSIQNCNFIKNGTFGLTSSGSALRNGNILNCGFGSGTQTNAIGSLNSNTGGMNISGTVTYAANVTPWVDPANGDFSINLTAAKSAGRGNFTETQASYAGTVGYPDIGAAQSVSTNASSAVTSGYSSTQ